MLCFTPLGSVVATPMGENSCQGDDITSQLPWNCTSVFNSQAHFKPRDSYHGVAREDIKSVLNFKSISEHGILVTEITSELPWNCTTVFTFQAHFRARDSCHGVAQEDIKSVSNFKSISEHGILAMESHKRTSIRY